MNMRNIAYIVLLFIFVLACSTQKVALNPEEKALFNAQQPDTVAIKSEKTEYEIIIIEPGFNAWLESIARPRGYYSQTFLENRNAIYVAEWNRRVLNPFTYNPNLYEMQIDYDPSIDYGYEVNYKLYYYFIYFQRKYNQRLAGFVPRI